MSELAWRNALAKLDRFKEPILVQKYGGASVETPEKIRQIAERIREHRLEGFAVVVVVSAMGKTTNQLMDLARQITPEPPRREMDMLLSTGERVTMSLLSMALGKAGLPAISFTGSQAGILTNEAHESAQIISLKPFRVIDAICEGKVVVLAGFQGVAERTKEITTLGRGGSDLTAIAMACALRASRCEILKDVDCVLNGDPRDLENVSPLRKIGYQAMLEMSFLGAKVIQYRAVEMAAAHKIPIYVGPAFTKNSEGTLIDHQYENLSVSAVNTFKTVVKFTLKTGVSFGDFVAKLNHHQIAQPQVLAVDINPSDLQEQWLWLTGPDEILEALIKMAAKDSASEANAQFSLVSLTGIAFQNLEHMDQIFEKLLSENIRIEKLIHSAMSLVFIVKRNDFQKAVLTLGKLL